MSERVRTGSALFAILSAFVLASCEVVIDADFPNVDPALVVYSFLEEGSDLAVSVYAAQAIESSESRSQVLGGAQVELRQAGTLLAVFEERTYVETFPTQQERIRYVTPWPASLQTDEPFELAVSVDGFPSVEATDRFPGAASLEVVGATSRPAEYYYGDGSIVEATVRLRVDDGPGRNYYFLSRRPDSTSTYGDPSFRVADAPFRETELGDEEERVVGIFFSDATFDGRAVTIEVAFETVVGDRDNFFLYRVSEAYYEYDRTVGLQRETRDNPFAEPTPLYSNVVGGHGVVAASSSPVRASVVIPAPAQ